MGRVFDITGVTAMSMTSRLVFLETYRHANRSS
jgi:hypothetical protein